MFDGIIYSFPLLGHLGSHAYDVLVSIDSFLNMIRRKLKMPYWSFAAFMKRLTKNSFSVLRKFKQTAIDYAKKHGYDGIILGHLHTPEIIDGFYFNTGDWVDSCTALIETETGEMEIFRFTESKFFK